MKATVIITFTLLANYYLAAQEISVTPVNEDFIQYIQDKQSIKLKSSDEHFLGAIPAPFNFHFSSEANNKLKSATAIPTSYDLREVDNGAYLTPVRSQGNTGTCWAFATYGALESYLLKQNKGSYDFSEQNMATCHGFDLDPSQGGNSSFSTAYLSRCSGPIFEEDDPYNYPDANTSCKDNMTPALYIEQARYLPGSWDDAFDADLIKQTLIKNGGLYINMYYNVDYLNQNDYTYYYDGTKGINHAVVLVGWDDNKIVTGGITSPESKGAWIVKNSWGSSWGEKGYFYISYKDSKVMRSVSYFPSDINYDPDSKIYYYDECGMVRSMGFGDELGCAIIKFTPTNDEILDKIGTYVNSENTTISIEVYDNFDSINTTNYLGGKNNVSCDFPGFHTITLDEAIHLKKNNDFYIKINYDTPGYNYPIPYESNIGSYTKGTTIEEKGKCWISHDGQADNWIPLGLNTNYPWDLCIKAYTKTIKQSSLSANFNTTSFMGDIPMKVGFEDLSEGNPTTWEWDFDGDSVIDSHDQNPVYTYSTAGNYSVTLIVSNGNLQDTLTKNSFITVGKKLSIEEIQKKEVDSISSPYLDRSICTQGIITAIHEADSLKVIYIQDEEQEWSGITVYDTKDTIISGIKVGDQITLTGTVTEINGATAIKDPTSVYIESSDNLISPVYIPVSDIREPYQSMMVTFENVYCSQTISVDGKWKISDGTNELLVDSGNEYTPSLNKNFTFVTGILTYENGEYNLLLTDKSEMDEITTKVNNEVPSPIDVNIYPNPTYGTVTIQFNNQNSAPEKLIVNTLSGKQLIKRDLFNIPKVIIIDLSDYADGIYIIKLIQAENTYSYKVIKK